VGSTPTAASVVCCPGGLAVGVCGGAGAPAGGDEVTVGPPHAARTMTNANRRIAIDGNTRTGAAERGDQRDT
jgi:hypothetical protein